jgi:hypothetical protein
MRIVLVATSAAVLCLLSQVVLAEPVLTFQGVGPVRLGMTAVAAEQALGSRLKKVDDISGHNSGDDEKSCWIGRRADGVEPELFYMFEQSKLTRIDVDPSSKSPVSLVKTPKAIGINSTANEIRRVYGDRAAVVATHDPDPVEGVVWMRLSSSEKGRAITFILYKGKIASFWTGLYPAIDYYEGCL